MLLHLVFLCSMCKGWVNSTVDGYENNIIFVSSEKSWAEAIRHCKTHLNGSLSTPDELPVDALNEEFWVITSKVTAWISIYGCYKGNPLYDTLHQFSTSPGGESIRKCTQGCQRPFFGLYNQTCFCLDNLDDVSNVVSMATCGQSSADKDITSVYEIVPRGSVRSTDGEHYNCGKVECENRTVIENCTENLWFLCWSREAGRNQCSTENLTPQNVCTIHLKNNGDTGYFLMGTFRPVNKAGNILECTFYMANSTKTNIDCNRSLSFFCTTNMTQSVENQTQHFKSTPRTDGSGTKTVLLVAIGILVLFIIGICVVVIWICIKMKKNSIDLDGQQRKANNRSLETTRSKLYELHEIKGSGMDVNASAYSMNTGLSPTDQGRISDDMVPRGFNGMSREERENKDTKSNNNMHDPIKEPQEENPYDELIKKHKDNHDEFGVYDHMKNIKTYRHQIVPATGAGNTPEFTEKQLEDNKKYGQSQSKCNVSDLEHSEESDYDVIGKCTRNTFAVFNVYDHIPYSEN